MTARVAILAAMPSELRPIQRALRARGESAAGVTTALIGVGTASARRATEELLEHDGPFDLVVVIGISGGVVDGCRIGDVIVPATVRHHESGVEHSAAPLTSLPNDGVLLTTDELILDPDEVATLAGDGVVGLDMETSAVAEVCAAHGVPWAAVRAISDRPVDGLVDAAVGGMARPDGRPDLGAVGRYLARRPWRITRLARLGRDASTAARAAAQAGVGAINP